MSEQERKIVEMLGEAWNAYLLLPVEHPNDHAEMMRAIHAAQALVLMRMGRRALNS